MTCALCGRRKAKRACPAVGQSICAVCCGTKRLVEIRCPPTCGYLASSREHPPAAVQRQAQRDVIAFVSALERLSDPQRELVLVLAAAVLPAEPLGLDALRDDDVADAARALAATFETASRGVIYEHQPGSLPAQRLVAGWKRVLQDLRTKVGERAIDRDAAPALRALERGARETARRVGGGPTAYIELVGRVLAAPAGQPEAPRVVTADQGSGGLILLPD